MFLHDNTKPHTSRITQEKILALDHPLYSQDLAISDFHFFILYKML